MFESITFFSQNRTSTTSPLDIGSLVECMLFYGKTHVVVNQNSLRQLLIYFGVDRVIELISENLLNIIYMETVLSVLTGKINGTEYHDACLFSSPQHTYQEELRKICIDVMGETGKGRRGAQRIQDLIKVKNHENIILEGARASFLNQEYINNSAKIIIQSLIPERINVNNIIFQTEKTERGIKIATNINSPELNLVDHKYIPRLILSETLSMENELFFSSNNLSEIATSGLSANLISHKVNYLLAKSIRSSKEIQDFQSFVFADTKSLREAINKKQIDLDDLISVLKKSQKFKKWILGIDPDHNLLKSYYAEVTKGTIVDKLPGKSARWGIFTGTGLIADAVATGGIGTALGVGLGVLDTFYLDKLISGWKPSQFIEDEVRGLLEKGT